MDMPKYAQDAIMNQGQSPYNSSQFGSGAAALLGGLFGNSGGPYDEAGKQYKQWNEKAVNAQNPFYNAGVGATGNFQDWLSSMKDPSGFINKLMNQYQESPYAKYQQQQAMRAGTNFGSANGLSGSTPLALQLQQNASDISSQDMNQWLKNVLGINTQYGAGNQFLSNQGAGAANNISNLYNQTGQNMAQSRFGQQAGEDQDFWNTIGGAASIASMFL